MNTPQPPAPRPTHVRWLIVALLMGYAAIGHFNRVSISVVGSERLIDKQGISEKQMGLVYSAFLLVYTLGMLPGGWFIDRFGPRAAMTLLGLGMGGCVAMTGALGWAGWSGTTLWLGLLVVRGIAGGSSVPLHPGAAHSVSLWMPVSGRAFANGLVTAAALVGIAFTYPGFGWLMDRLDWPAAFVVSGIAMMAYALVWRGLAADGAGRHPWANDAERNLVLGPSPAVPPCSGTSPSASTLRDFLGLLRDRGLVLLTLSYAALGYFQYLFFYWMQYYFEQILELPKAEGRQAAFLVTIAMAIGMAAGGWCTDMLCRVCGPRRGRRIIVVQGMGMSAALALLGIAVKEPVQVVLCFALANAFLGMCEGAFWTTATDLGGRTRGLACALMNTGGNGGGAIAPALTPWLAEHFGWPAAIAVACGVCALGSVLWFGIGHVPRDSQP